MAEEPRFEETESLVAEGTTAGKPYLEFLRVPSMSVGVYALAAGSTDPQQPHAEDELYVVTAGHATVWAGGLSRRVGPGSVVYVPAEMPHHFTDITEDLQVVVAFSPPESRPTGSAE